MARLSIGTSGWMYPHWRGVLYPRGLAERRWLERYASAFSTVEVNATFYRLPTEPTVLRWRARTPPGFRFACKGSRYLTHMKRLTDVGAGLERFFSVVTALGPKLAVVLWQLPPQMTHPDPERLDRFLDRLPRGVRHAFEFRSEGWYTGDVVRVLERHRAALCEHDLVAARPPAHTGGFRYVRMHGAGAKYAGRYGREALRPLARDLSRWARSGRDAFVYFNNDAGGNALYDAADLASLVHQAVGVELPAAPA